MSFLSELAMMPPAQREQLVAELSRKRDAEREIDHAIRHLERRLRIRRIASLMPAEAAGQPPSSSPGHASAGAFPMESTP